MRKLVVGSIGLWLFAIGAGAGAPAAVEPLRVCEVLQDLNAYRGKTVALLGRYSFRENGRFLSESGCQSKLTSGTFEWPAAVRLATDADAGPKPPENFDIDTAATSRKLQLVRKATTLGKFRFGSLEYDRWAIVYGRVEAAKEFDSPPQGLKPAKSGLEPAPAQLLYRGDGLIFFLSAD